MSMKKLMAGALASALVAPMAAFSAIDDQGMQYVSAGEGLSGSFRTDVLIDTNEEGVDASSEANSLRLYLAGDLDLGGGLKSTYYYEARTDGRGNSLDTHAYDLGLKGPFGHFAVGDLSMVSYRMVPSADLTAARGPNRESFGSDPGTNGIRYESPVINGFQFGASAALKGAVADTAVGEPNPDGSLDEFALAVRYSLPVGLELAAAYESKDVVTVAAANVDHISFGGTELTAMSSVTVGGTEAFVIGASDITDAGDTMTGYRFGARYGQDNWLVSYEYRGYDGYNADIAPEVVVSISGAMAPVNTNLEDAFKNGFDTNEYEVHAVGAQAKVDRFTVSAGYSQEENTFTDHITVERDSIVLDAAYNLGSRSRVVLGWKKEDREATLGAVKVSDDVSTTFLYYRIDF